MKDKDALFKNFPIIVVPGLAYDYAMRSWKKILEKDGYSVEVADLYNLAPFIKIGDMAKILSKIVDKTLKKYNKEKCHLLGFSMGSIVSLYFLHKFDKDRRVDKCICVTAPLWGCERYFYVFTPLGFVIRPILELFPNSTLLKEIRDSEALKNRKVYLIHSKNDFFCIEPEDRPSFIIKEIELSSGHIIIYCFQPKGAVQAITSILRDKK